jgi:hypothetical protein
VIGRSAHRDRRCEHQDRSEATRESVMPASRFLFSCSAPPCVATAL